MLESLEIFKNATTAFIVDKVPSERAQKSLVCAERLGHHIMKSQHPILAQLLFLVFGNVLSTPQQ